MLLCLSFVSFAQKKPAQNACVESYFASFNLSSATSAQYTVEKEVTVNNEDGIMAACMMTADDDFRTLTSFSALVTPLNGGKPVKSNMKNVRRMGGSHGQVDNFILNAWAPDAPYPFVVRMKYVVTYRKAVPSFPVFDPVEQDATPVKKSSYSLIVPRDYPVKWAATQEPSKSVDEKTGKDVYLWEFNDIAAITEEPMMPPISELTPHVYSCPVDFEYLKTSGSQKDWAGLAAWNASLFPSYDLPQALETKIKEETKDMTELEKVRYVYDYLRENTRYVSVQLGIGGFAPAAPSVVEFSGYGDCKGLSFFAKAMLRVAGVESRYVVLNTKRKSFPHNFASMGQTNHAMLCVPLQKDTVWLECTNPAYPLGYKHENIAGHQVLLVDDNGGDMVRVSAYPDSLSVRKTSCFVTISPDGAASIDCESVAALDNAEDYIDVRNWEKKNQLREFTRGFRATLEDFSITGVTDNFSEYDGTELYVPSISVRYKISSKQYVNNLGSHLLVPVLPFNTGISVMRGERVNDFVLHSLGGLIEEATLKIPEGYKVESVPEMLSLDSEFFKIETRICSGEGELTVRLKLIIKPGYFPKEAYAEFREQSRLVGKFCGSNIVLTPIAKS